MQTAGVDERRRHVFSPAVALGSGLSSPLRTRHGLKERRHTELTLFASSVRLGEGGRCFGSPILTCVICIFTSALLFVFVFLVWFISSGLAAGGVRAVRRFTVAQQVKNLITETGNVLLQFLNVPRRNDIQLMENKPQCNYR